MGAGLWVLRQERRRPSWGREVKGNQAPLRLWSGASRLRSHNGSWMNVVDGNQHWKKKREGKQGMGRVENIWGTFKWSKGKRFVHEICSRWGCIYGCVCENVGGSMWVCVCERESVRCCVLMWNTFCTGGHSQKRWKPYSNPKPEHLTLKLKSVLVTMLPSWAHLH